MKRKGAPGTEEGRQGKKHLCVQETPPEWSWNDDLLPVELVEAILDLASGFSRANPFQQEERNTVTRELCRCVCNRWREILAPAIPMKELVWNASFFGMLNVLKWAREFGCILLASTCAAAAKGGNLEVLKWLREVGVPWDYNTTFLAAQHGHFEVLKWARENQCQWDESTCEAAAFRGDLAMLSWAVEAGCFWGLRTCCAAARGRQRALLKRWILPRMPYPLRPHVEDAAAEGGCFETFKVLEFARGERVCENSASGGHLDILAYATDCWYTYKLKKVSVGAAKNGHLHVLDWFRDNGYPLHQGLFLAAADNRQLNVLEWAKENECDWDTSVATRMAANGDLDLLQWAKGAGYDLGDQFAAVAAEIGDQAILEWARTSQPRQGKTE